jgi:HEAT repeat protein
MMADSTDETVRRSAAVQLGLAASLSDDPSALKSQLIENLNHAQPTVRSNSALALGWDGNWPAVKSLIHHLSDPDQDVQASVVAALSSVGDDRVFDILTDRMENAGLEEQRNILLNLWRFSEQNPRVEKVYLDCMDRIAPDLRLDALSALAMMPLSMAILNSYKTLLSDMDPRIRRQVVENLSGTEPSDYEALEATLHDLIADRDVRVRQAAIRLLAKR